MGQEDSETYRDDRMDVLVLGNAPVARAVSLFACPEIAVRSLVSATLWFTRANISPIFLPRCSYTMGKIGARSNIISSACFVCKMYLMSGFCYMFVLI